MSKFGVLVMGPAGAGKVDSISPVSHAFELICLDYLLYSHDPTPPTFTPKLLLRQP
jgi:hypothetical protein